MAFSLLIDLPPNTCGSVWDPLKPHQLKKRSTLNKIRTRSLLVGQVLKMAVKEKLILIFWFLNLAEEANFYITEMYNRHKDTVKFATPLPEDMMCCICGRFLIYAHHNKDLDSHSCHFCHSCLQKLQSGPGKCIHHPDRSVAKKLVLIDNVLSDECCRTKIEFWCECAKYDTNKYLLFYHFDEDDRKNWTTRLSKNIGWNWRVQDALLFVIHHCECIKRMNNNWYFQYSPWIQIMM